MPEETTLQIRSAEEIARTGATNEEVNRWVDHHLNGNWFTSDLLRLMNKADESNLFRLSKAFPEVFNIWWAWRYGEGATGLNLQP